MNYLLHCSACVGGCVGVGVALHSKCALALPLCHRILNYDTIYKRIR